MADPKRVDGGSGLAGVADLLSLVGGKTSTTKNTGDTSGLYDTLSALQAQDPNAGLQSLFQQTAGALPGLTSRLTNAVGARSGNNGAVQALLQKTLQQTTLAAQQQMAQQQAQNLATRGQVAGQIAQATNSPKTTSGLDIGNTAKILGIAQGASKLPDLYKKGKDMFGGLFNSSEAPTLTTETVMPAFDLGNQAMDISDAGGSLADFGSIAGDVAETAGNFLGEDTYQFADGGLIGRDSPRRSGGSSMQVEEALDAADKGESVQERRDRMKQLNDAQKKKDTSKAKTDYDKSSNMVDQATGIRFADGGEVDIRSGGGRRSSAPSYSPDDIIQSIAQQNGDPLATLANPRAVLTDKGSKGAGENNAGTDPVGVSAMGLAGKVAKTAAMMAVNPAMAIASMMDMVSPAEEGQPSLTGITSLAGAIANPTPLGLISTIAKLMAPTGKKGEDTQGFNSLGQATGTDNANGYSGLAGALGLDSMAGSTAADSSSAGSFGGFGGSGGFGGFGGLNGSAGGGSGNGEGGGGGYGAGGSGGDGGSPGGAAANGGQMKGPGTGTSDSMNVKVSNGEYVVSADVVNHLGASFFDELQKQFHTPVTK